MADDMSAVYRTRLTRGQTVDLRPTPGKRIVASDGTSWGPGGAWLDPAMAARGVMSVGSIVGTELLALMSTRQPGRRVPRWYCNVRAIVGVRKTRQLARAMR
jgi:hypothetical protein